MLVNWNLLVSPVKHVSFERVTCSFVGVTCSFVSVTCSFVGVTCSFVSVTCSFVSVTCSFVGVTCSFDPITFCFVIPKWWILQHIYSGRSSVEEVGEAKLCEFPTNLFWFCILFLITTKKYENDKNDFLQTQRIKQLDKYSIRIKYSYLHSSTNRKIFHRGACPSSPRPDLAPSEPVLPPPQFHHPGDATDQLCEIYYR